MILHLMSAGVPTSWVVVAAYRRSYGIANNAAASWFEKQAQRNLKMPSTHPYINISAHLVMEAKEVDGAWQVERSDLHMSERHLTQQQHDERSSLLQENTAPFPLDPAIVTLVTNTLRQKLIDFGYLLPRAEWERKYPGQKIISDHFAAFFEAERAHRASGADGDMPFELRWAQFLPPPEDFVWPFDVRADDGSWIVTRDGEPFGSARSDDEAEARLMMRLLNSGYRDEDLPALLADCKEA